MTFFIGVCGGTGAGKSTLASALQAELGGAKECSVVSMDSYYHDGDFITGSGIGFDHPDSVNTEQLSRDLDNLRAGKDVSIPVYDHKKSNPSADVQIVSPTRFVIVEGILLFAFESLRRRMDSTVFVDCEERVRLERRVSRDVSDRGRPEDSARRVFEDSVKPMHDLFVQPYKHKANLIVNSESPSELMASQVAILLTDFSSGGPAHDDINIDLSDWVETISEQAQQA